MTVIEDWRLVASQRRYLRRRLPFLKRQQRTLLSLLALSIIYVVGTNEEMLGGSAFVGVMITSSLLVVILHLQSSSAHFNSVELLRMPSRQAMFLDHWIRGLPIQALTGLTLATVASLYPDPFRTTSSVWDRVSSLWERAPFFFLFPLLLQLAVEFNISSKFTRSPFWGSKLIASWSPVFVVGCFVITDRAAFDLDTPRYSTSLNLTISIIFVSWSALNFFGTWKTLDGAEIATPPRIPLLDSELRVKNSSVRRDDIARPVVLPKHHSTSGLAASMWALKRHIIHASRLRYSDDELSILTRITTWLTYWGPLVIAPIFALVAMNRIAWGEVSVFFAICATAIAPSFLSLRSLDQRLHLMGVDYKKQARLMIWNEARLTVLPALVVAGLFFAAQIFDTGSRPETVSACGATVVLLTGLFLIRLGCVANRAMKALLITGVAVASSCYVAQDLLGLDTSLVNLTPQAATYTGILLAITGATALVFGLLRSSELRLAAQAKANAAPSRQAAPESQLLMRMLDNARRPEGKK